MSRHCTRAATLQRLELPSLRLRTPANRDIIAPNTPAEVSRLWIRAQVSDLQHVVAQAFVFAGPCGSGMVKGLGRLYRTIGSFDPSGSGRKRMFVRQNVQGCSLDQAGLVWLRGIVIRFRADRHSSDLRVPLMSGFWLGDSALYLDTTLLNHSLNSGSRWPGSWIARPSTGSQSYLCCFAPLASAS